jgi:glutamine synthetase adenylyltransferase
VVLTGGQHSALAIDAKQGIPMTALTDLIDSLARTAAAQRIPSAIEARDVLPKLDYEVAKDWLRDAAQNHDPAVVIADLLGTLTDEELMQLFCSVFTAAMPDTLVQRALGRVIREEIAASIANMAESRREQFDEPAGPAELRASLGEPR